MEDKNMDTLKQNTKTIFQFILERYNEENNILMTEREMCERFGISRNALREVMSVAKLIGAVTVTKGANHRLTNKKEMKEFYKRYLEN